MMKTGKNATSDNGAAGFTDGLLSIAGPIDNKPMVDGPVRNGNLTRLVNHIRYLVGFGAR